LRSLQRSARLSAPPVLAASPLEPQASGQSRCHRETSAGVALLSHFHLSQTAMIRANDHHRGFELQVPAGDRHPRLGARQQLLVDNLRSAKGARTSEARVATKRMTPSASRSPLTRQHLKPAELERGLRWPYRLWEALSSPRRVLLCQSQTVCDDQGAA
jgi:hypothetical protein